jgi:hypothetical protein
MPKPVQWLLFEYIDGEITFLSKPFRSKQLAEKARSNEVGILAAPTLGHGGYFEISNEQERNYATARRTSPV